MHGSVDVTCIMLDMCSLPVRGSTSQVCKAWRALDSMDTKLARKREILSRVESSDYEDVAFLLDYGNDTGAARFILNRYFKRGIVLFNVFFAVKRLKMGGESLDIAHEIEFNKEVKWGLAFNRHIASIMNKSVDLTDPAAVTKNWPGSNRNKVLSFAAFMTPNQIMGYLIMHEDNYNSIIIAGVLAARQFTLARSALAKFRRVGDGIYYGTMRCCFSRDWRMPRLTADGVVEIVEFFKSLDFSLEAIGTQVMGCDLAVDYLNTVGTDWRKVISSHRTSPETIVTCLGKGWIDWGDISRINVRHYDHHIRKLIFFILENKLSTLEELAEKVRPTILEATDHISYIHLNSSYIFLGVERKCVTKEKTFRFH